MRPPLSRLDLMLGERRGAEAAYEVFGEWIAGQGIEVAHGNDGFFGSNYIFCPIFSHNSPSNK